MNVINMVEFLEQKIEKIIVEINRLIDHSNAFHAKGYIAAADQIDIQLDNAYNSLSRMTDKRNRIEIKELQNG